MSEEKKEILERIAMAFPKLSEEKKIWMAGYISCAEDSHFARNTCEDEKKKELVNT